MPVDLQREIYQSGPICEHVIIRSIIIFQSTPHDQIEVTSSKKRELINFNFCLMLSNQRLLKAVDIQALNYCQPISSEKRFFLNVIMRLGKREKYTLSRVLFNSQYGAIFFIDEVVKRVRIKKFPFFTRFSLNFYLLTFFIN